MIIDFIYGQGGGSGSGVTPEEVQEQIQSALTEYTPTSGFSTINGSAITEGEAIVIDEPDLTNYWDSAQTESAISAATAGKADKQNIQANFGAAWFPAWNSQGIITGVVKRTYDPESYINGKKKAFVDTNGNGSFGSIYAPVSAGTAGEVLVSTGNGAPVWSAVTIPDLSAYWTSAETQAHIDSAYTSATTHIEDVERVTAAALNELHSEVDAISGASENYITSAYVNTALASYTPTSGFSTINGSAITAGGNLVIEGGSGSVNIIELTKAEYDALSAYTEDAIYVITDAAAINMDDYATSANVNTALSSYTPTSGFSTINGSAITAGGNLVIDADLTNYWDSAQTQAHIDSAYTSAATYIADVERVASAALNELNTEVSALSAANADFVTSAQVETQITSKNYTTSAATATQIATATANMVTSTTVSVLWKGTQAQYDQISPKDPNTLYIIISA